MFKFYVIKMILSVINLLIWMIRDSIEALAYVVW